MRRFYESFSISIFSRRQVLSPLGVLLGFSYYLASGLSLVADGPALEQQNGRDSPLGTENLKPRTQLSLCNGVILVLW